jgi:hypothetical protein
MSSEYNLLSLTLHNIAYSLGVLVILPAARIVIDTQHGHHENVYGTHKPAFSSLPVHYMLLQAFVMNEM